MDRVRLADMLRTYRGRAKLTQERLAARCGISVEAVSMLERGIRRSPRESTVAALAAALGLSDVERDRLAAAARTNGEPTSLPDEATTATSGITELVLEVVDLERAEHFYNEILGFPTVARDADGSAVWLEVGSSSRIGLWTPQLGFAQRRPGVHVHYSVRLTRDVYAGLIERLEARGVQTDAPACSGCRWGSARHAVQVFDSDGHTVEFWTGASSAGRSDVSDGTTVDPRPP